MKIQNIEISKFRSIESGSFHIQDIVGIVGQNNSGKTAVLRALNSFFNSEAELPNYLNGTNLYSNNRAIPKIIVRFDSVHSKAIYNPYVSGNSITVKQEYNKQRNRLEYYVLNNGTFESANDALISELKKDVQFILIPTDRTSTFSNKSGNSVLEVLLRKYFSSHTSKRDTLTPKVKDAFDYMKKSVLNKVVTGIEGNYLARKGFSIKIDTRTAISYELFLNDLEIQIIEDGKEFNLNECGSGIQSLVAIAVHRYLAKLNHSNFVIGLEEPEINLHPQGQKELIYTLIKEVENSDIQILFTTHSTVLVDQLDHTKIVLTRKVSDSQRSFKTRILQIRKDFWAHYGLVRLQYDKFHKFRNSEFFFANHVLVTESSIDSEVFRVLLENKGIKIELKGISILELGGIKSLKYAYYLLKELEIPKTIIVDKDFFFEYQNGDKETSRYSNGFFNYKNTFRTEPLIAELFPSAAKRSSLEGLLTTNHSRALDVTVEHDIISMKFNMEMDLVSSRKAQDILWNFLSIPMSDRTSRKILVDYKNTLKALDTMLHVINNLAPKNLPNSYKRLVKRIREI